jgi:pyridoxine 4-dehydrogenase
MHAAIESGCTFWNAGEHYGTRNWNTQTLIATYFATFPEDADKIVLSVKGAFDFATMKPNGSPDGIKRSIDKIMKDLNGKKRVDIFECSRVDPNTPLEVTLKYLEEEYVKRKSLEALLLARLALRLSVEQLRL